MEASFYRFSDSPISKCESLVWVPPALERDVSDCHPLVCVEVKEQKHMAGKLRSLPLYASVNRDTTL